MCAYYGSCTEYVIAPRVTLKVAYIDLIYLREIVEQTLFVYTTYLYKVGISGSASFARDLLRDIHLTP